MKSREYIDKKYIELLRKHSICAMVTHVSDGKLPVHEIVDHGTEAEIRLNVSKINEEEYEEFLAYNVMELLLPRLSLETERLRIRRYQDKDAENLFEGFSNRDSCYNDGGFEPFSEMDAEYHELMERFKAEKTRYIIALKDNDEAIGLINLMACDDRAVEAKEIGYSINPSKQRQGYALEAVSALLDLLLGDLYLELVIAGAIEANMPSHRMLEKLGFHYEGRKHKAFYHPEQGAIDLLYYYKERQL